MNSFVYEEHMRLLYKCKELEDEVIKLKNTLSEKDKTNESHLENIEEFKSEIYLITRQYDEIIRENMEITRKNVKIRKQYNEIIKDNAEIKKNLKKINDNQLFYKYILAIQDVDNEVKLKQNFDSKYDSKICENLVKLREINVEHPHYLCSYMSTEDKNKRRSILSDKICSMNKEIEHRFEVMFPELLQQILYYICTHSDSEKFKPTNKEREEIELWWEN